MGKIADRADLARVCERCGVGEKKENDAVMT